MLDGTTLYTSSFSLAYLEKIVSSTGQADCSTSMSSSAGWIGCIATFKSNPNPPPMVILNSPLNCTSYAHNPVTFVFTPGYATTAQLWMNVSGIWQQVASNQTNIVNGAQNSINYTMPQDSKTYIWGIKVSNTVGNVFSSNYTIRDSPLGSGMALTVDGSNILDSSGNKVFLRGIGIACGAVGAPDWLFWTSDGGDSWGDQWNYSTPRASSIRIGTIRNGGHLLNVEEHLARQHDASLYFFKRYYERHNHAS